MAHQIAIYPGTFDPITFGHMDIIKRAIKIVDRLVIAVADDSQKTPVFSLEQRVSMVEGDISPLVKDGADIVVEGFKGLSVECARRHGAKLLIRGLRAASDFEFEFQMAGMNSKLDPTIQTMFLPASEGNHFIASRVVKEVARLDGDISGLVSELVAKQLKRHFDKE